MRLLYLALCLLGLLMPAAAYWMDDVPHVGKSPYHSDPNYKVYRNVKAYGAKGDGVTDDTAAINRAISDGNRCAPQACTESTVSPAVVYFPSGTYLISGSIVDYFYTQLIGDPTNRPVIKATASFPTTTTLGLVDGNRYGPNGQLAWKAVNVFYRQVRNMIFDTTAIPASANAVALHWPSSQATTLANVDFRLAAGAGSKHVGLFIEEGSGGIMTDLVFTGGGTAARLGNQQYTARNWSISGAQVAIEQLWNWGWTYQTLRISNCPVGIKIADANTGSVTILDSQFTSVTTAIQTGVDVPYSSKYPTAGSLVIYNTIFTSCPAIVRSPTKVLLVGNSSGSVSVGGYVLGRTYTPTGPVQIAGQSTALFPIASSLKRNNAIYSRSKPHYTDVPLSRVATARSFGAKGDGATNDLVALQNLFNHVAANPTKIAFVDAGHYIVSNTLTIPPGVRIVGEALASYIIGSGSAFTNAASPRPVVRVGAAGGQTGVVEWSDMIVSTRGPASGAKVIEWNLASPAATPSGMWDVHVRIGGYAGSLHQMTHCPVGATPVSGCVGAYISMHVTAPAANLLMEGTWFWVADHDIEDQGYGQVSIYAGRGVLIEATQGNIWLSGVGSEHHSMYQFQLANTQAVFMAQAQSETPYYQPNPVAPLPITVRPVMGDPDFAECANGGGKLGGAPCAMAWGLRVLGSRDVAVFGAGFYSFFNNNNNACAQEGAGVDCQSRMVDVRNSAAGTASAGVVLYNLNTIGSAGMVRRLGVDVALAAGGASGFADNLAVFKY